MGLDNPKISLIIPVYNSERHLRSCLDSILAQTYREFEVICVDDSSTDLSTNLLTTYSALDKRIKVFRHEENLGAGEARRTAIKHARSDYLMFFDSDDSLSVIALERIMDLIGRADYDLIVYGVELNNEISIRDSQNERTWYDLKFEGEYYFSPEMALDINVELWNKVFKKKLFDLYNLFSKKRLFDDVEIVFKYLSLCQKVFFLNENLYIYRQREGSLMSDVFSSKKKASSLLLGLEVCNSIHQFYKEIGIDKSFELVCTKLFLRNFYYSINYMDWKTTKELLDTSHRVLHEMSIDYSSYKTQIVKRDYKLICDIYEKKADYILKSKPNFSRVKLLISHHRPTLSVKSECLLPIHVGRALTNQATKDGKMTEEARQWMLDKMIGDDTGENISDKNRNFCELTAHYWAWKNQKKLDNPDYIGFMHYRRHFIFKNPEIYSKSSAIQYFDKFNQEYINTIGLNDNDILREIEGFDVVSVRGFDEPFSVYDQFQTLNDTEWDLDANVFDKAIEIVLKNYPDYGSSVKKYLEGQKHFWLNMFIFKKEIFNNYSEWLFKILFELESKIDFSNYSVQGQRILGHIAERLYGIYLTHLLASDHLRYKELPVSGINQFEIPVTLFPSFENNNIPVVFASDNNYAKYLLVVIISLIENSTEDNNYDIYILDDNISEELKKSILSQKINKHNVKITFVNIHDYIPSDAIQYFHINNHFSIATYFRFFIEFIFKNFNKVIYLDCDIVIENDIANLYKVDLGDNVIGACRDYEAMRIAKLDKEFSSYVTDILGVEPDDYLQAGVLIYDIKNTITNNTYNSLMTKLRAIGSPRFVDQDIINSTLKGKIKYLPGNWNFNWFIEHFHKGFKDTIDKDHYSEYLKGKNYPYIIHFAGILKPWRSTEIDYAKNFWKYARKSPYYESMLSELFKSENSDNLKNEILDSFKDLYNNNQTRTLQLTEALEKNNENKFSYLTTLRYKKPFLNGIYKLIMRKVSGPLICYMFLKQSKAFDYHYYLTHYPDVANAKKNPLMHFVKYGWREGRNPNAWFNTSYYVNISSPDVKRKGVNPLIHYILYGNKEGRKCN